MTNIGYFHFRFSWPPFESPTSTNVGPCRQRRICVGHGRKYGGNRWNRFASSFHSKVISTSGFHCRFRGRHLSFCRRPPLHARAMSGVPMRMIIMPCACAEPVQNTEIPSQWNCTHFSPYHRSGRIPFRVTCYATYPSLLLHLMWNWILQE